MKNIIISCSVIFYLPSMLTLWILCPLDRGDARAGDLAREAAMVEASSLMRAEDFDSAVVILEAYLQDNEPSAEIIYQLGLAHDLRDDIPHAMALYFQGIAIGPDYWPPYAKLGLLFDIFAEYDSMNYYLGKAVSLAPHAESLYYDYAYSFDMQGREDSALVYYYRALDFDSLDSQASLNIGGIWGLNGNLDSAAHYTNRSLAIAPDVSAGIYNLAEVMAARNENEAAIDQFQRALALDPNLVAARKRLGDLYESLGDSEMAAIYYREFLDNAPIIYLDDIDSVKAKLDRDYPAYSK